MKKLTNLFALVILVSMNALTPFSYAQEATENNNGIIENEGENYLDLQQSEESGDVQQVFQEDDVIQTLETEEYEADSQLLEMDIQGGNNPEEIEELIQERNLNIAEIDLNNPIHLYRDGELTGSYTGLTQAINEAESGDVIKLIDDISVSTASVVSGKSLTINGNNYAITRIADITTITVNEGSSLKLQDITITDNAVKFAPNRYNSLLKAQASIPLCLGGVNETRNESGDVTASGCATENVDTAKTNPQLYSVGDIYGDNLTISNSLNSKGSAAIIVEKGGIEMINSNFIHNGASGGGRGGAIRVGPNTATNIVDESPITKIVFSGCYFESNYSSAYGGALAFHYAPEVIMLDNCIFSGNTAYMNGGAIHVPNIRNPKNPIGYLPALSSGSTYPVGTLYINNTNFYNNWCGNDGNVIENDDLFLEINESSFEHNYGTQPLNTSVGVICCQAGGGYAQYGRGLIRREYHINNSYFKDTNTDVLTQFGWPGSYIVDNCIFEDQDSVLLSYHGEGEIKNSIIRNSNPFKTCGEKGYIMYDFTITPYSAFVDFFKHRDSVLKLENNTYSNDCTANEYMQVRDINDISDTRYGNIIIEGESDTRVLVHKSYYDSINIQGTDEIYYGATIDDGKYAYIKKNNFYNFDEFNTELENFSYSNSGYQLESGKTMLFYLDSGYTELRSGSISTTTNLYGKETDIYNITYEGMDGINFEGITHTYKFINLDHTQYLSELTPYTLNTPSRNGYRFEGRFLDSEYTIPVTSIGAGTTGDITLYAKREELGYSGGGGGGGGSSDKTETPKEDATTPESSEEIPQNDDSNTKDPQLDETASEKNTEDDKNGAKDSQQGETDSNESEKAYEFAKEHGITTMPTIQKAQMNSPLTRIAMAKMLSQYAINILGQTPDETRINKFKDVTEKMDKDYDNGVTLAYQLGIMGQNMPNNNFRPKDEVTRAEFVTALSRLLYSTSDGEYKSTSKYYKHHMEKLKDEGIVTNTDPNMKERRGYVMIMLMRSVENK